MALADVTYRFITGTLIKETEHNTNNSDLIDALTDGLTDINIGSFNTNSHLSVDGNSVIGSGDSTIEINGMVSSSIIPASTYDLGSTSKPFAAINLNNGATDGGAIYFGSKFIKATADGTELDISGWTTHDFNSKPINNITSITNTTTTVTGDVTASGGVRGDLDFMFAYGENLSVSSPENFLLSASFGSLGNAGMLAKRSGGYYYISVRFCVVTFVSTFTLSFYLYKNGSVVSEIGSGQSITGNGTYLFELGPYSTQQDSFSQGDLLQIYTLGTSGVQGTGFATIGVYYDS